MLLLILVRACCCVCGVLCDVCVNVCFVWLVACCVVSVLVVSALFVVVGVVFANLKCALLLFAFCFLVVLIAHVLKCVLSNYTPTALGLLS